MAQLPIVKFKGQTYFVDVRLKELRNTDFTKMCKPLDYDDENVWGQLSKKDREIIIHELINHS